jgi:hypothetical protein
MAEPGEFLGVVARAELRSASGDWAEAAALWGQVTAGMSRWPWSAVNGVMRPRLSGLACCEPWDHNFISGKFGLGAIMARGMLALDTAWTARVASSGAMIGGCRTTGLVR